LQTKEVCGENWVPSGCICAVTFEIANIICLKVNTHFLERGLYAAYIYVLAARRLQPHNDNNYKNSKSFFLLTLLFIFIASCGQVKENKPLTKANNMEDFERLLDATFPFVEDLLKKHGEFFPLASAIEKNDSIAQVGTYDKGEQPESDKVIADLKAGLREGAKNGDYKAIAIFYDVRVIDPNTNQKTDAVVVFVENKKDMKAYKLFYPYTLTKDSVLTFTESWRNETEKEIFGK